MPTFQVTCAQIAASVQAYRARYVTKDGGGCWLWGGPLTPQGYGRIWIGHGRAAKRKIGAHRLFYLHFVGPIPQGLQLDHLCRVRRCVNPAHLEPVTNAENARRGLRANQTHCVNGHAFDRENTRIAPDGSRLCRACRRSLYWSREKAWRTARRQERGAEGQEARKAGKARPATSGDFTEGVAG